MRLAVLALVLCTVTCNSVTCWSATKSKKHGTKAGKQQKANPELKKAAKTALLAVEALQSAAKSGVKYSDYMTRKADAQIQLDRFTNEYGAKTPVAVALAGAMVHFDNAGALWKAYLTGDGCSDNCMPADNTTVVAMADTYPGVKAAITELPESKFRIIYLPEGLNAIWDEARKSVESARGELTKMK